MSSFSTKSLPFVTWRNHIQNFLDDIVKRLVHVVGRILEGYDDDLHVRIWRNFPFLT